MEIPIVVEANEINVAGFVTSIDLATDVGPQGDRGAVIFAGPAAPTASPSTTPLSAVYGVVNQFQSGDLYIKTASPNYGWTYIFQDQPSGGVWAPIVPMSLTGAGNVIYTGREEVAFSAGQGSAEINILDILGRDTDLPTEDKFIVTATAQLAEGHADAGDTYVVSVVSQTVTVGATLQILMRGAKLSSAGAGSILSSVTIAVNFSIGVIA